MGPSESGRRTDLTRVPSYKMVPAKQRGRSGRKPELLAPTLNIIDCDQFSDPKLGRFWPNGTDRLDYIGRQHNP